MVDPYFFFTEYKEWLIGVVVSITAFFGGRKSKKQTEKSQELNNIIKVRGAETKLVDDLISRIDQLIKYNDYIEKEHDEIKKELFDIKKELLLYKDRYGELEKTSTSAKNARVEKKWTLKKDDDESR